MLDSLETGVLLAVMPLTFVELESERWSEKGA